MEDLSVIIKKSFFENMYKKKTETFGTVQTRMEKMNEQRKNIRRGVMIEKRKIPTNMSPIMSPAIIKHVGQEEGIKKAPKQVENGVNKRLEMLAKWKAEKEKKMMEEKKKQKPVFKVTHVPTNIGLPNLETVNTAIKGKPISRKFAPTNHKFKPPSNIQPINFEHVEDKSPSTSRMVTRSQTRNRNIAPKPTGKSKDSPKKKGIKKESKSVGLKSKETEDKVEKKALSNRVKPIKAEDHKEQPKIKEKTPKSLRGRRKSSKAEDNGAKSNENTVTNVPEIHSNGEILQTEINEETIAPDQNILKPNGPIQSSGDEKTPIKTEPPVYISPFVTVTRGKNSARKEYEARKSRRSFSSQSNIADHTSPKAGAAYFTWRLENEVSRLQELCQQWTKYKEQESPPEEAISMIDVAIGQTNLLLTKKFVQFRGLIERCENKDSETPVSCEDLHGFWDMMHIQVDNLDKRFDNLQKIKANNWQEIIPEVKKEPVKRKGRPLKSVKASAGLMEAIKAARKKKLDENSEKSDTKEERKTPKERMSSRILSVKSSEAKHRNSSPGLMMMKVAQYAKGVETPMKSILKSDKKRSVQSQSKSVLFRDARSDGDDCENDLNVPNSQHKGKSPSRRSERLNRVKLF